MFIYNNTKAKHPEQRKKEFNYLTVVLFVTTQLVHVCLPIGPMVIITEALSSGFATQRYTSAMMTGIVLRSIRMIRSPMLFWTRFLKTSTMRETVFLLLLQTEKIGTPVEQSLK